MQTTRNWDQQQCARLWNTTTRQHRTHVHLFKHGLHGYELASMNWCRMFLKAIFLSDICTGDGMAIDPQYWNGRTKCNSDFSWPRTEKPPIANWTLWKKHLTSTLALGQKDTLQKLLGNWAHHQGQTNGYFLEKDGKHLFQRLHKKWFIYTKIPSWWWQLNFHHALQPVIEHDVPHNCWRVQIRRTQHTITITRAAPIIMKKQPMTTGDDQLEGQWGIQHKTQGSREQLAEAICKGKAIAVSDGSFQDQQGAAAWMIEGYDKNNWILGMGSTPGFLTDQSATAVNCLVCGEFLRPYNSSAKKSKFKVDTYESLVMAYQPYIKRNQGNQLTQRHPTMTSLGQSDNYGIRYQ